MLRFQNLLVMKYLECFFILTKCREALLFGLFLATDKNNRKINMINIDKENKWITFTRQQRHNYDVMKHFLSAIIRKL